MTPERYKQVGQIYLAALELESNQRAAYLGEACAGDEDLQREVESLLEYQARSGGLIDQPLLENAARAMADAPTTELIGQNFGHYRILSLLGHGGMGEVYLALDTRLGRKVAIKLLLAQFTTDSEGLRRFEQEARAASALNHPNIITVYEIGEIEGRRFIVTEYVEGETLRQRMASAPQRRIRLMETLEIAAQVAAALQAAHEAGITHRDIKPENTMLRNDGLVKVLDFGLAKLGGAQAGSLPEAESLNTRSGMVMGTASYMSPEQARGEKVDHRTDIFSLGVMIYEMLAGRRPFEGATASDVMAAALTSEPVSLAEAAPEVPASLWRIVQRCLEKRPGQRFQSAGDLGFALKALISSSGSSLEVKAPALPNPEKSSVMPTLLRRLSSRWIAWTVTGALALGVIWLAVADFKRPTMEAQAFRGSVSLPENLTGVGSPAISPDGRHLAFTAFSEGRLSLWIRPLDLLTAKSLPGTEGAESPFWSPDSRFIGFFAQGKLKKIALADGALTTLCEANGGGGTWNRDGEILFAEFFASEIKRVSAGGGTPATVIKADRSRQEEGINWPAFLPDGRHFVFSVFGPNREKAGIYLGSLDGGEAKRLVASETNALYAPSFSGDRQAGYLLFVREGTLLAQPFDAAYGQLTGDPFSVADRVLAFGHRAYNLERRGFFSVSDNGRLIYRSHDILIEQLGWFDRTGKPLGTVGSPGRFGLPKLSRDGKQVAAPRFDSQTGTSDIWLFDLSRGAESRFTSDPGDDQAVVWSPKGSQLMWASNREGVRDFYRKTSSGGGQDELFWKSDDGKYPNDWSGDGRFILYVELNPKNANDIWVMPLSGDRRPSPYLTTQFDENFARFSPDSKWVAYYSNESGSDEIYVQPFPATGGKWKISIKGGNYPLWRRDGKEIFYMAADKLMAVEVTSGERFEAGLPKMLFDCASIRGVRGKYAVKGDGQRFLVVTRIEETGPGSFTAVLNWTADLKR